MKKILNIGVLGCANVAQCSVIPAILKQDALFHLEGVASRNKEKANEYALKFNTKAHFSYASLLNEKSLDAIYIPLPNSLHAEWIGKALDRNLHVLVEKSLACSYEDVIVLNQKAKKCELALVENFQFRFHPQLAAVLDMVKNKEIGELRCVRSSFGFPPFADPMNIRYQAGLGGGALLDAGAYPIKISQILLGEDLEIKAATLSYDESKNVDIWGGGFLQQRNGELFSEIAFGFDHLYQCNIELWGSKGKLTTNRIFTSPPDYEPEATIETKNGTRVIKLPSSNHFQNMMEHFYNTIHSNKLATKEYEQNIHQAKLLHEFRIKAHE